MYNKYVQNGKFESELLLLEIIIIELNELFKSIKALQYETLSKKLNNIYYKAKTSWSILKIIYNEKKIALILPLLLNDKFVNDIKIKACIFDKCFAEQCTP